MSGISTLGKANVVCPPIIYGTSYLGNLYRELSWEEKMSLIREWFRVTPGHVVVDSAGKYGAGLALEVLGRGLKELGIPPERISISNKLGWYRVPLETTEPTFEPGAWANLDYDAVQRISYQGIMACWEQGCQLLGGEYLPGLVSVHDPDEYLAAASGPDDRERRLNDIREAYRALFELKGQGKVKAVGIGSKDWLVIRELFRDVPFDWVMFANKLTLFCHPQELILFLQELKQQDVGIINSAIFNAGFLTGGNYFDYRKADPGNPLDAPLFEWRERFFRICEKYGVKPGDACLKFAFSAPQIDALALNPGKPERMARNLDLLKNELPAAFWSALKSADVIDKNYPYL